MSGALKKSCLITGGNPIRGSLRCFGAKNFATKAMVAALLGESPSTLSNMPDIGDTRITAEMLTSVGATVQLSGTEMSIDPTSLRAPNVRRPDSGSNRIPVLLLAALLHRFDEVIVPTMGGCTIGARPVDFHVAALRAFGAEVEDDGHHLIARRKGPLKATHMQLPYPSVGATETCLFLSVLARGRSVITNVANEPEITALITMLNLMGAVIHTGSDREICVDGVERLEGTRMAVLGDRIEAASMACLACASDGDITVEGIRPETLSNFIPYFRTVGGGVELMGNETLRFFRKSALRPSILETNVFPGFATDWQQPFAILLTQADGISLIHETVYENRFGYLAALNAMGARTQLTTKCLGGSPCRYKDKGFNHSAIIIGRTELHATESIEVPDLRAGLAYIIAAALAQGTTRLTNLELVERGYGDIISRLANLNLNIMAAKESFCPSGKTQIAKA